MSIVVNLYYTGTNGNTCKFLKRSIDLHHAIEGKVWVTLHNAEESKM